MRKNLSHILILLAFGGLILLLAQGQPDQRYLQTQQFRPLFEKLLTQAQKQYPARRLEFGLGELPDAVVSPAALQLKQWHEAHPKAVTPALKLGLKWERRAGIDRLLAQNEAAYFTAQRTEIRWTAVLPPLLIIATALLTRNLLLSLGLGIALGSLLVANGDPLLGAKEALTHYGWHAVSDGFHVQILVFAALLLGMVGIMNVSGGTRGIVVALQHQIASRRSTQLMASLMGLLIFFDDYANCFVIGTTMRPVTDRYKISREKLAYIVDTTAAPVTTLAIVSTWIGYQVGLVQEAVGRLEGVTLNGFSTFIQALPYRFYCFMALGLLFLLVAWRRDFGPMYKAERRAIEEGLVLRDGALPLTSRNFNGLDAKEGIPHRWQNAVYPVLLVVLATLVGLYISGGGLKAVLQNPLNLFSFKVLGDAFAAADSGLVLLWSSTLGCLLAAGLVMAQRLLNLSELTVAFFKGVSAISTAAILLIMAWTLNDIAADIGTATYLIALFRDLVQPLWLPLVIFGLAAAISFSIGSSWNTMALLMPVAIPLAFDAGGLPLMLITIGAVFDGSIFGDHCSPLTDTSILTSIGCSSDHLDHIKTQLPYGLLGLTAAGLCCYLPAGAGVPFWVGVPLGLAFMTGVVWLIGRDPEADALHPPVAVNYLRPTDPAPYME
ncbi:MAG: Na+/H+ antiporter NhaC family protein [Candidatus Sericytochromatia bacterium]